MIRIRATTSWPQYGLRPAYFHFENVLTSMFLHGGWMHVLGNMWFLWIFGDNIEDILGHGKYLLFYLLCGVAAAMAQVLVDPGSRVPMVGASGAIAGVMGAYLVKFPRSRVVMLTWFIVFFTFELPAWLMLIYWFVMQVFSGVGRSTASGAGRHRVLRARRRLRRRHCPDQPAGHAPALLAPAGPLLVSRPVVTLYTRAGLLPLRRRQAGDRRRPRPRRLRLRRARHRRRPRAAAASTTTKCR